MQKLRKLTAAVAVTATVAAGFPPSPVFAQARVIPTRAAPTDIEQMAPIAPVDQVALISSTIHRFPNAGEPLKLAISDLIVKHPNLAPSVAMFLRNNASVTRAQKQAIFAGLADALKRMGILATDLPPPMPTKALPATAVVEPEPDINPWVVALLVLAAAGAAAGGCALAGCFNSSSTPSPVPSPN